MAKICNVCGTKLGLLGTFKVQDGLICLSCSKLCSTWQIESISNIKKYRNDHQKRLSTFSETKTLKNFGSEIVHIDTNHRLFYIGKDTFHRIYSFDEIINYGYDITELQTNTKKKGGITRALVGGAIAGPAGAIVGSSTAKSSSKTSSTKTFYVNLKTYSGTIKKLIPFPPLGFKEFIDKCIHETNLSTSTTNNVSISDKLKTISELREQGLITSEEFENKKKELLNQL